MRVYHISPTHEIARWFRVSPLGCIHAISYPHHLSQALLILIRPKNSLDRASSKLTNLIPLQPEMLCGESVLIGQAAAKDSHIIRLQNGQPVLTEPEFQKYHEDNVDSINIIHEMRWNLRLRQWDTPCPSTSQNGDPRTRPRSSSHAHCSSGTVQGPADA